MSERLLKVSDLAVTFDTPEGEVHAVNGVGFDIGPGEVLALVGESGSGKTQTALALVGLLAQNGRASGRVVYRGSELMGLPEYELNRFRGSEVAMIFQDPGSTLNPYLNIGQQMTEALVHHRGRERAQARREAAEMLHQVGFTDPDQRMRQYHHQLSGGMQQRVVIAMGLLCRPRLLIADEPTTALDVTVQADIVKLLIDLCERFETAILLITHDLGVVAGLADRVLVMYAGEVMEQGGVRDIYYSPAHPYTAALLRSMPRLDRPTGGKLRGIAGNPPSALELPSGCPFRDRCELAYAECTSHPELTRAPHGGLKRCHLASLEGVS